MEKTILKYTRSKNILAVVLTVLWVAIILLELIMLDKKNWYNYGMVFIGVLFVLIFGFRWVFQFGQISNDTLVYYIDFLPQKIHLNEIEEVERSIGDYKIKTPAKMFRINPQELSADSKKILEEFLAPKMMSGSQKTT